MNRNINQKIYDSAFKDYSETVWVHLRTTKTKGSSYDPFRQTGFTETKQNPLPVKAIIRHLQANSLIIRELGLVNSGTLEIIIQEKDLSLIKLAQEITYDGVKYSLYKKALGNRVQIYKRPFKFVRVVLFRTGK